MSQDHIDEGSVSAASAEGRRTAGTGEEDAHASDLVMPGFRFHPTEEELIEFYLRRKVEGRRFNVDLITFLDLYRFDPWELPAMAVIGEKEWFFYVPRDRKYRNGDRPNRVTASGYWKATGADRMIRGENSRPIGLKKTLVFYSGKAPKGVRSSWIMNEYRLPPPPTDGAADLFYKSEISLCRVYKRSGIDDGRPSSSINVQESSARPAGTSCAVRRQGSSPSSSSTTPLSPAPQQQPSFHLLGHGEPPSPPACGAIMEHAVVVHNASPCTYAPSAMASSEAAAAASTGGLACTYSSLITMADASMCSSSTAPVVDELSRLVGHGQIAAGSHFPSAPLPPQMAAASIGVPPLSPATASSNKLWDWSLLPDTSTDRDYSNSSFK